MTRFATASASVAVALRGIRHSSSHPEPTHRSVDSICIERLGEMRHPTVTMKSAQGLFSVTTRDHDLQIGPSHSEVGGEFESIPVRQADVDNRQFHALQPFRGGETLARRGRCRRHKPQRFECLSYVTSNERLVLDDQSNMLTAAEGQGSSGSSPRTDSAA